jgi:hypothetical protein
MVVHEKDLSQPADEGEDAAKAQEKAAAEAQRRVQDKLA